MPGISQELETLRHRARGFVLVRGLAALLATVFGLAFVLGGLDALVRWQHLAVRFAQSGIWLAAILGVGWRFLVRPLRARLTDLDLAKIIHRQWPTQTPDLLSAVEFEKSQLSTQVGAPLLQQVTVSRAQLQLATVPWQSVLRPRRAYWSVAGAGVSLVMLGLAVSLSSELTSVGASRLLSPWAELDWPRRTTLVYLNSELVPIDTHREPALRTGQGDPLTLYIENRTGPLPSKVLFVRKTLASGTVPARTEQGELRQTTLRDSQGQPHQVAVASMSTSEPFEFRAQGGDDDRAPWMSIEVVPPPRVHSFEITLTPPAYTGRPSETVTSGVGHLQGLVGSQVHIHCRAAARLQAAWLNKGNEPRKALSLSDDGLEFRLDWTLSAEERSTYWLDLEDPYGLHVANPPRYEIRGVGDQEPVASLLVPETDLRVTAQAEIPIEGVARDDLGLVRVELVYELPMISQSSSHSPDTATNEQHSIPLGSEPPNSTEQSIRTTWNLAELSLPPGSQVRFWLQATDACDLHGMKGQVGRSAVRVVSILTDEEKQLELSGRQIQIAERITQLRDRQAAVEQSTREIGEQWKSVGSLRPSDRLDLERVQTQQREIARDLGETTQGVVGDLQELQKERVTNRLIDPQTDDALARWDATLSPLAAEVLPAVQKQLDAIRMGAAPSPGVPETPPEQTTAALEQALSGQRRAADDLSQLATELSEWKRDQDLEQRFSEIVNRQTTLREQSVAIGQLTSGKTPAALSPQEQVDLARAADRQGSLARDVEQLTSQLEAAKPATEKTPGSESLPGIAEQLAELSVAATMRGASDELRQNHVQAATDAQQKLIESLETLKRELDQERVQTARNDVEELKKSVADAHEITRRQTELRRRTEALSGPSADGRRAAESAEVQRLQLEIEEQTSQLADRLRREQHRDSSSAAQRAEDRMREARENLEQEQVAQSLDQQSEALDELEQTRESLGEELQEANQRADEERLAAVGQLVVALLEREKATREETMRVEGLRVTQGKWTRGQLKSVQLVADSQRDIAQSCQQARDDLGSEGVLGLCLNLATEHFSAAAKRLDERDTGALTQAEQRAGETLLDQFISSLASPNPPDQPPNSPAEPPPEGEGDQQPQTGSPLLAVEVRLLLRMQEELLTRTRGMLDLKSNGHELSAEHIVELRQLRDRQKRLVETARTMIGKNSAVEDTSDSGAGQP